METRHRSSTNFSHSSPLDLRNHNFHHPASPIEGVRGHTINVHPQVVAVPYGFPGSFSSQSTMNPSQDGLEMGRRHLRPVPPTGFRIYHSRRESGAVPETTLRHRNLPHLRVLPPDVITWFSFLLCYFCSFSFLKIGEWNSYITEFFRFINMLISFSWFGAGSCCTGVPRILWRSR